MPREGSNLPEFSVSELSSAIKGTLERAYGYVRLRGEISGFRGAHSSGHCYFSLKDDKARIEAVIWRQTVRALRIKPAEGLEVIATGRITTFPGSSKYQIVIDSLEPAGIGALMALLEERKKRLAAEGLFDKAKKRPLPFLPRVIGIVTSPTGAVIRDMLAGFTERFPARVLLWPVRVQGETCAAEVAAAIDGFNALPIEGAIPRPDVLIVARGGGSLEDLWGFNEEIVARAAAMSAIPLVSAVGHETDWTLIDWVADARAPTPTKAAEWVVPKYAELAEQTGKLELRVRTAIYRLLDGLRTQLRAAQRGLPRRQDLLALPRQRYDSVERRLGRALLESTRMHERRLVRIESRLGPRLLTARFERGHARLDSLRRHAAASLARMASHQRVRLERVATRLSSQIVADRVARRAERVAVLDARLRRGILNALGRQRRHLEACAKLLTSVSYQGVLARGFALVRDARGRGVRSAHQVTQGERLDIELADGHVAAEARAIAVRDDAPASPGSGVRRGEPGRGKGKADPQGGQGSLF
ncbi:MAG TPA: exodeoxyribonuclease VII large subunit [Hyphomicrobiaceae bacterium]|nr:exodeoxyribonuclease VII large subunit [Hyphomicrobiaceae bacterium]